MQTNARPYLDRCFWAAALVVLALVMPPLERALSSIEDCEPPCHVLPLVFVRAVRMACWVVSALGICAVMPVGLTPFTQAGRGSLVLLLCNQYVLALFQTPLTMAMMYALERFGGRSAVVALFVMCAALAWPLGQRPQGPGHFQNEAMLNHDHFLASNG